MFMFKVICSGTLVEAKCFGFYKTYSEAEKSRILKLFNINLSFINSLQWNEILDFTNKGKEQKNLKTPRTPSKRVGPKGQHSQKLKSKACLPKIQTCTHKSNLLV